MLQLIGVISLSYRKKLLFLVRSLARPGAETWAIALHGTLRDVARPRTESLARPCAEGCPSNFQRPPNRRQKGYVLSVFVTLSLAIFFRNRRLGKMVVKNSWQKCLTKISAKNIWQELVAKMFVENSWQKLSFLARSGGLR